MSSVAIPIAWCLALLVLLLVIEKRSAWELRRRFAQRERLAWPELGALFCRNGVADPEKVHQVLRMVASEFDIHPGLLRPADRFDAELRPARGGEWDSPLAGLFMTLDSACKRHHVPPPAAGSIQTLDDFVQAMLKLR